MGTYLENEFGINLVSLEAIALTTPIVYLLCS